LRGARAVHRLHGEEVDMLTFSLVAAGVAFAMIAGRKRQWH